MTNIDYSYLKRVPSSVTIKLIHLLLFCFGLPIAVQAEEGSGHYFDIPKNSVSSALQKFAVQSKNEIMFASNLNNQQLIQAELKGTYTEQEALALILAGTELTATKNDDGVFLVVAREDQTSSKKNKINKFASNEPAREWSSSGGIIEVIEVTAQKRGASTDIIDVPISITAMTGGMIEEAGIQNINDLSYAVPNLSVWEQGPGTQTITLRGVGNVRGSSSLVGLYIDEIPTALIPGAQLDLRTIDLERVEVLRGPQGTLYGQGSVGGTIRYITNNPSFDGLDGKLGVSLYDTKKGGFSKEYSGVINAPIIDDILAIRIAGTYEDKAGWIDQPAIGAADINDSELSNLRAKILFQPSDDLSVSLTAIQHRNEGGGSNVVNLGDVSESLFQVAVDPTLSPSYTDDYDVYNMTASYDLGFATLISSSSRVMLEHTQETNSQFAVFGFNAPTITELLNRDTYNNADAFSQEIRLSSNEGPLLWTLGAFYNDLDVDQGIIGDSTFDFGTFSSIIPGPSQAPESSESKAVFIDLAYTMDLLTLGLGTRYFEDDRNIPSPTYNPEETFYNLSSKLYAAYALSDDSNIYFSISEGFRSGGFNNEVGVNAGGDPDYDPETLISYELGAKASLFNSRVNFEAAVFHSQYKDYQTLSFDVGSGSFSFLNSGEAEITGAEWNVQWAVIENLSFGFSGSVIDGEFTKIISTPSTQEEGDPLENVPEYSFSLSGDYTFQWSQDISGFARIDFNRQGKNSYADRTSGLAQQIFESEPISFLNMKVGAKWDNVNLELFGRNLLDEDKSPTATISELSPQNRPRTLGLNVQYDF